MKRVLFAMATVVVAVVGVTWAVSALPNETLVIPASLGGTLGKGGGPPRTECRTADGAPYSGRC